MSFLSKLFKGGNKEAAAPQHASEPWVAVGSGDSQVNMNSALDQTARALSLRDARQALAMMQPVGDQGDTVYDLFVERFGIDRNTAAIGAHMLFGTAVGMDTPQIAQLKQMENLEIVAARKRAIERARPIPIRAAKGLGGFLWRGAKSLFINDVKRLGGFEPDDRW